MIERKPKLTYWSWLLSVETFALFIANVTEDASLNIFDYLITWNFRDTLISRFCENFVFWITLISRFWVRHNLHSWQLIYFEMPLNNIKRLNLRNNNVKINKNAGGGFNLGNSKNRAVLSMSTSESIDDNIHLHWLLTYASHLIFASCYVRDTYCSRHLNFAIFLKSRKNREI